MPQHCQCGQPRGGHQHGEKAPEGHPCHLEEEEPERRIIMKKEKWRIVEKDSEKEIKGGDAGVSIL